MTNQERQKDASVLTTPEEAAYRLFDEVNKGKPYFMTRDEAVVMFAKCMLAVRDPQALLEREEQIREIKINPVKSQH